MAMRWLGIGCALLFAAAAQAGDGRLEINQHCATATGCSGSDVAGFPVSTSPGKSYVLTSSLAVADANTNAVNLAAGAALDLNGFSITGPAQCTGTPPTCVGLGTGRGVSTSDGASVRNGRIAGMGGDGVGGSAAQLEKLLIEANGDAGVQASGASGWRISDCRIVRNAADGIRLDAATRLDLVRRTTVYGNGNRGVVGYSPLIVDSAIYGNAGAGFESLSEVAIGSSGLAANNGGAGQPQAVGDFTEVGPNACDAGACP